MPSSRAWVSNLVIATSCNSASQAVKIEETMMQRKLGCILLQKDAISDANLRLGQWQDIVDPRQLMNGILAEVQKLASIDSNGSALFAVSMHIFMCLAPPRVKQYVSANLRQCGQPSSTQVYPQRLQAYTVM